MISDKLNTFAGTITGAAGMAASQLTGTALPTATGTAVCGDVIDLWNGNAAKPNQSGAIGPNGELGGPLTNMIDSFGGNEPGVELYAQAVAAITGGGTEVVRLELVACSQADLAGGTVAILRATANRTGATPWAAGELIRELCGTIPPVGANLRYLGIRVVTATAVLTGGTLYAALVRDFQQSNVQG